MERPSPTKEYTLQLTGHNPELVSAHHHGLIETPLNAFYPDLNHTEMVVISSGSWMLRKYDFQNFTAFVENAESIYEIFNYINGSNYGFCWLNLNKDLPEDMNHLNEMLNPPNGGKNLEIRVANEDPHAIKTLKDKLIKPVDWYPEKTLDELSDEILHMLELYPTTVETLK